MRTHLLLVSALISLALLTPSGAANGQMIPRSVEIDTLTGYYAFMSRGGFDQDKTVKLENIEDGLTLGGRFGIKPSTAMSARVYPRVPSACFRMGSPLLFQIVKFVFFFTS